jgi:hypothetical protein
MVLLVLLPTDGQAEPRVGGKREAELPAPLSAAGHPANKREADLAWRLHRSEAGVASDKESIQQNSISAKKTFQTNFLPLFLIKFAPKNKI